jgi:RNA polymerase II subunit A-like phosphatase
MSEATALRLPPSTPFPVKVISLHASRGDAVNKHQRLLSYSYWEFQDVSPGPETEESKFQPKKKERVDLVGTFEVPVDGVIDEMTVEVGDEILSSDTEVARVIEPCSHSIQYGGLCALCGKSLEEEADYSGYKYEDRAPISMSHGTSDLKISKDEAEKVEERWAKSLIKEKKLILVVDLDQTVIHATVDPTIGEWMKDEHNANYPSLKDVKSFILEEEPTVPPHYKGPRPQPYKRMYYVKLRPGLREFLGKVSEKYELHIYTMGTRAYAKSIAKCIDPEGSYFADRILSRDESGSLTQKSLERLFPTDTSMVVIIDDRGDVWNWSEHLVKVVPFDFFVGIGDINSNFLPRQKSLLGPSKRRPSIDKLEEKMIEESQKKGLSKETEDLNKMIEEIKGDKGEEASLSEQENAEIIAARSTEREASLEEQEESRPLAKLQKDLDSLAKHTERLLYDDDDELVGLEKALLEIHDEFYTELDKDDSSPNVTKILPKMKQRIFSDLVLVFSGLLPLGANLNSEAIVQWVRSFGAKVNPEVTMETTHIIAKNPYTYKARLGKTMVPGCKIMHPDWLFHCMSHWERVDSKEYEVAFEEDRVLPQAEVDKYREKMLQQASERPSEVLELTQSQEGDLLGGDMDWLDDEEEEELSDDSEEEDGDKIKRSLESDDVLESKKRKVREEHEDSYDGHDDNDDDDDDDFAAELMEDLDDE